VLDTRNNDTEGAVAAISMSERHFLEC
jgi:hypothetical protein